jgi:hypothetical protein
MNGKMCYTKIAGTIKVEKLSHYGKTPSGLPEEAMKKQRAIVLANAIDSGSVLPTTFAISKTANPGKLNRLPAHR